MRPEAGGPLFRPVRGPQAEQTAAALTPGGVYSELVMRWNTTRTMPRCEVERRVI